MRQKHFDLSLTLIRNICAITEAEEAQAKIEELRDQSYTEGRTALLSKNDSEMSDLIQQREDHTREFDQSWSDHEKKL